MHSTLWLCSAADWRESSPALFSCSAILLPRQHKQLGACVDGQVASITQWQAARLPSQCCRDCGPMSAWGAAAKAWAPVWQCSHAGLREEEQDSCAAWTSIGSGNWKCVERHLHHRCYLLILVCKGSNYPPVTAATCTKLDTCLLAPLCWLPSFFLLLHCFLFCKNVLWNLVFYVHTGKKKAIVEYSVWKIELRLPV